MFDPRKVLESSDLMDRLRPSISITDMNEHFWLVTFIGAMGQIAIHIHKESHDYEIEARLTEVLIMYHDMTTVYNFAKSTNNVIFKALLQFATYVVNFHHMVVPRLWVTEHQIPYGFPGITINQRGYMIEDALIRKLAIYSQGTNKGTQPFSGVIGTVNLLV
jgi:hypothetical protein